MQRSPNPDDFRYVEDAVSSFLRERGWHVFSTGQEHAPSLQRWSPDFWVNAGFWADAKVRNLEYRYFLIEWAEVERHRADFPPTVYFLVERESAEIAGWITADDVSDYCLGLPRNDHRGNGSGDPYVQVLASRLRDPASIDAALLAPRLF